MAYRNAFGIEKKREIEVVRCISEWAVGCQDANDEINDMKEPVRESNKSMNEWVNEWIHERISERGNQSISEGMSKSMKEVNLWKNQSTTKFLNEYHDSTYQFRNSRMSEPMSESMRENSD